MAASDSSLSPIPDDLDTPTTAGTTDALSNTDTTNNMADGKKRKANATVKTTKKRKTTLKAEVDAEEDVAKPKKRARKVKVEKEVTEYVHPRRGAIASFVRNN
jgi:GH24 family phage-related lysozyme (muramidase)